MPVATAATLNRSAGATYTMQLILEPVHEWSRIDPLPLAIGEYSIGCASGNSVVLQAAGVRPRHCTITVTETRVIVTALDPRTWVNDDPIRTATLRDGDRLALGPVEFRLREVDTSIDQMPQPIQSAQSAPMTPVPAVAASRFAEPVRNESIDSAMRLRDELEQQLRKLREESARQQQKLQAALNEQAATAADIAEKQRQAAVSEARSMQLTRKETFVRDLILDLQNEAEVLLTRRKDVAAEQRQRRAAIEQQQQALEQRENTLATREIDLAGREGELSGMRSNLKKLEQELEERQRRFQVNQDELSARQSQLESRQTELRSREVAISDRERLLNSREQSAQQDVDAVEKHQYAEIERQRASLLTREKQLAAQMAELEADRQALAGERDTLRALQAEFESEQRACRQLQDHWETKQHSLEREGERLETLRRELSMTREQLATREDALDLRARQLASQAGSSVIPSDQIQTVYSGVAESELAAREAELDRRATELDERARTLEADWTEFRESLAKERETLAVEEARVRDQLERQEAVLEHERAKLRKEADELSTKRSLLADEAAALRLRRDALEQEREELAAWRDRLEAAQQASDEVVESLNQDGSVTESNDSNSDEESGSQQEQSESEEDSRVMALRSKLSDLFHLSQKPSAPSQEHATPNREIQRAPEPPPRQIVQESTPTSGNAEDDHADMMDKYMQNLIARSRKQSPEAEAAAPQAATPVRPVQPIEPATVKTYAPLIEAPVAVELDEQVQDVEPSQIVRPTVDKQAARANMDSLRELANLSARSAVAKHTWKKVRGEVFVKTALAIAGWVVTAALFTSPWWRGESYRSYAILAGAVSLVMSIDLIRAMLQIMRRAKFTNNRGGAAEDRGNVAGAGPAVAQQRKTLFFGDEQDSPARSAEIGPANDVSETL